jgi:ribose/xylose/arabinose/galactoside ABC-type transport system permease subunit
MTPAVRPLSVLKSRLLWPLVALAALLLFNLVFTPHFFSVEIKDGHLYGNLIDILKNASPIMLLALGLTLVIATRGIDISVGSVVAISAGVVAVCIGGDFSGTPNMPIFAAMAIAVGVATLAGVWNGLLVSRVGMQPIIATLILFVAGRGIAMVLTNAQIVWLYNKDFFFVGSGYWLGLPFPIFLVLAVLIVTAVVARRTSVGLFIEAVGINPTAARFSGVSAKNVLTGVYAFSGFCAGVAGLIVCANVKSADGNNAGNLFELDAILAVVLGGTSLNGGKFNLVGSLIGALIIQTLTTTIYAFNVAPEISQVVKAIVVYAICLMQAPKFRAKMGSLWGRKELAHD